METEKLEISDLENHRIIYKCHTHMKGRKGNIN